MVIGFLSLEMYFPYSHSLKDKRKIIRGFKDRIKHKYNVAVAELDYQTKWQRTKIGVVTISSDKDPVDSLFNRILVEAERAIDGEITASQINYL